MNGRRLVRVVAGTGIFLVHVTVALAGLAVLRWLFADPPGVGTLLVVFVTVVLGVGYLSYRAGTVRVVASLRAQKLSPRYEPEMHRRLERISAEMGLDQPPVFVADLEAPNALSLGGPQNGAVVIDQSLLDLLSLDELEGVMAHELAHLERYDTFLNTLAVTALRILVGVTFVVLFPVVLVLAGMDRGAAWIAGHPQHHLGLTSVFRRSVLLALGVVLGPFVLAYLAYSRRQEFAADRRAAEVSENPVALARALGKIHRANDPRSGLLSPLYTHDDGTDDRKLFSTHPTLDERIERLLDSAEHDTLTHYVGRTPSP